MVVVLKRKAVALFMAIFIVLCTILPNYLGCKVVRAEEADGIITKVKFERFFEENWGEFQEEEELPNGTKVKVNVDFDISNVNSQAEFKINMEPKGFKFKEFTNSPLISGNDTVGTWSISEDGIITILLYNEYKEKHSEIKGSLELDGILELEDTNNGEPIETEVSVKGDDAGPHKVTITFPDAVGDLKVVKSITGINENGEPGANSTEYDRKNHVVTYTVLLKAEGGVVNNIDISDVFDEKYLEYCNWEPDYEPCTEPVIHVLNDEEEIVYTGFDEFIETIVNESTNDTKSLARGQEIRFSYKMHVLDELYKEEYNSALNTITASGISEVGPVSQDSSVYLSVNAPKLTKKAVSESENSVTWRIEIDTGDFSWEDVYEEKIHDSYEEIETCGEKEIKSYDYEIKKDNFVKDQYRDSVYYYEYETKKSDEAIETEETEPVTYSNKIDVNIGGIDLSYKEVLNGNLGDYIKLDKKCIETESQDDEVSWEVTLSGVQGMENLVFSDTLYRGLFTDDTYGTDIYIDNVKVIKIKDKTINITNEGNSIVSPNDLYLSYDYSYIRFTFSKEYLAGHNEIKVKYKTKKNAENGVSHVTYTNEVTLSSDNLEKSDSAEFEEERYEFVHKNAIYYNEWSNNKVGYELKTNEYAYSINVDLHSLIERGKLEAGDTITLFDTPNPLLKLGDVKGVCIVPVNSNGDIESSLVDTQGSVNQKNPMGCYNVPNTEQSWPLSLVAFNGEIEDDTSRFKVSEDGENITFEITFDDEMMQIANDTYGEYNSHPSLYIEYTLKAKNDYTFAGELESLYHCTITNKVQGTGKDGVRIGSDEDSRFDIPKVLLEKQMRYDESTAPEVHFTIDIPYEASGNPYGNRLVLKDVMGSSLTLMDDTNKQRKTIMVEHLDANGNVIEKSELTRVDNKSPDDLTENEYAVSYDALDNEITFNIPDEQRLRITYIAKTSLMGGETITFDNFGNTVFEPESGLSASNKSDIDKRWFNSVYSKRIN